jgi:hypothetical protein
MAYFAHICSPASYFFATLCKFLHTLIKLSIVIKFIDKQSSSNKLNVLIIESLFSSHEALTPKNQKHKPSKKELGKINVHPIGVEIMALKTIHHVVKFEAVDPKRQTS